jgi:alpha-ribazole phosphatase
MCYGRADVPTDWEPDHAADVVLVKPLESPAVIYSSPSSRCLGLATALASRLGSTLRADARLMELDHGRWEGRRWSEIYDVEAAAVDAWGHHWETVGPPGGESAQALEARVKAVLEECSGDDQSTLWVTHAGVIRAAWKLTRGHGWAGAMALHVEHLAVYSILPVPRHSLAGDVTPP